METVPLNVMSFSGSMAANQYSFAWLGLALTSLIREGREKLSWSNLNSGIWNNQVGDHAKAVFVASINLG